MLEDLREELLDRLDGLQLRLQVGSCCVCQATLITCCSLTP
jgi:hypothetical protein